MSRVPGGRPRTDSFEALGLDHGQDLTDDDVRSAWRRIAAASHPDRPDGGDPGRFAAAAAAYTELRTASGRGEARANLTDAAGARAHARRPGLGALGRPAMEVAVAAALIVVSWLAAGRGPAGPALTVGVLTWLGLRLRRSVSGAERVSPQRTILTHHPLPRRKADNPGTEMAAADEKSK